MLTLKTTRIVFLAVLAALIYERAPWYGYVVWGVLFTLPLFWGSYHIGSNFYIKVICRGPKEKKEVVLTFDDGPMEQYTPEILEVLAEKGVTATFFLIGKNIPGREDLVRKIYDGGHLIGNHSDSHHVLFDLFSTRKMRADLRAMNAKVREILGVTPRLFRPPYGVTNPNLARAIRKEGVTPIGWNVRSLDTVINDPKALDQRVSKKLKPGSILLFHDTSRSTLTMLPGLIDQIKSKGYTFTSLDKMCNLTPYA
ncbi:polysaccharide deacetylase family protein [Dinghuibacter silviterrae]|uniref:Peptidoglycan/xylan/chitin deacetylase (PgdA/CDA1 family) n=1 Tax=Dinghuibacter silviterrae TaxID=1539049 RepID=A0A4R8DXV7_9BACT|nr:polysaccharide deacetylase family protein [Dinghuibacter silviterrae]TDX02277.1 peptidoglycan/xylan/chitin deacetylase (PgdA/CDA1 family) [Dinghuibacter silviterrae]